MKIIIVGAGEVGLHLAKNLSWEGHEIIIIDPNQSRVDRIGGQLDVLAIRGSGTSAATLLSAGADKADMLIAVTSIDEVNIVACMLAKQIGVQTRVARIRNQEYSLPKMPVSLVELGIQQIINPELEAAREVVRMIRFQHATDIVECADGRMLLVGVRVELNAPITGKQLKDLTPNFSDISFRVVAIYRNGETLFPTGRDIIQLHDTIYVMTANEDVNKILKIAGKPDSVSRDIMLLGGGRIGRYVASELEKDKSFNIKLIESDLDRSQHAADQLVNTMVVRGREGIDIDILALEGISEMGIFAALSDDDENNIVTSLFARHLKVKRTITLVSRPEYMAILRAIGLDTAINERILTSDAIMKYLLGGRIMAVSSLRGIDAEVIEFVVGQWAKVTDQHIKDISWPKDAVVGAIEHGSDINIAVGDSLIRQGDRVVVFCHPRNIPKLEKLFKE